MAGSTPSCSRLRMFRSFFTASAPARPRTTPQAGSRQQSEQRPEYTGGIGLDGLANLESFVRRGGTLIALDEATRLPMDLFPLAVRDVSTESEEGSGRYYCPGSLLHVKVERATRSPSECLKMPSPFRTGGKAFEITLLEANNKDGREIWRRGPLRRRRPARQWLDFRREGRSRQADPARCPLWRRTCRAVRIPAPVPGPDLRDVQAAAERDLSGFSETTATSGRDQSRVTISARQLRLPAASAAWIKITFVPMDNGMGAVCQKLAPAAVPWLPRVLLQVTAATPVLSVAVPRITMLSLLVSAVREAGWRI